MTTMDCQTISLWTAFRELHPYSCKYEIIAQHSACHGSGLILQQRFRSENTRQCHPAFCAAPRVSAGACTARVEQRAPLPPMPPALALQGWMAYKVHDINVGERSWCEGGEE